MIAPCIIFFLLFLLPFVIAPFGVTQFEDPKVIIAEGAIIILFLVTLLSNKLSFRDRKLQILLYGSAICITLVDLILLRTSVSFFGNQFRMQGIFLLWLLLLFSFLSSQIQFPSLRAKRSQVPSGTLRSNLAENSSNVTMIASSVFLAIIQSGWTFTFLLLIECIAMLFLPLNASQRYVGTLGEPNALAAFAIFVWPFGWFGLNQVPSDTRSWKVSLLFGKSLLFGCVGLILLVSDSRSALVAFGIQLFFLVLTTLKVSFTKAAGICLVLFFLSYALPFFQNDPYENRVEVWKSALYAGMINPGIGQGFGNIEVALKNASSGLDLPIQYYYVDSSHNIFLDWWVAGGAVGLALLLYIVYVALRKFIKTGDTWMFVLLIGMLTVLSFNPASVVGLLSFWWIVGRGLKE